VLIAAGESAVKQHPAYAAAKAGDISSAWRLVSDALPGVDLDRLRAVAARASAILPVHAIEAEGINRIPMAMAAWIGRLTGLPVVSGVVQANRVGHTGASGWHRLATQALFDGPIDSRASYLLVDDFVGQGGTFANLRGHVLSRGGGIAGLVALTGKVRSAKIALQPGTLTALRSKHGSLETWWAVEFGFDFSCLTHSEAECLLRVDADTIRSRVAEARQRTCS
jgi:hypothetical protein